MSTHAADPVGTHDTETTRWRIDAARSSVEFHARTLPGFPAVKGRFDRYRGTLDLSAQPAIELTVETSSLDTGNQKRDAHLRSPAFFDAEQHPHVRFVSESAKLNGDRLRIHGCLHAAGKALPLQLVATVRRVGDGLEVEASTDADHRQLGMTWKFGMPLSPSRLMFTGCLVRDAT